MGAGKRKKQAAVLAGVQARSSSSSRHEHGHQRPATPPPGPAKGGSARSMSFAHTSSRESRAADRMDGFIELLVKGGIERAAVDEWLEAFKAFDADGDGTCSVKELGTVMRCLGIKMTEAQVQDLVTEFDANGSGTIDNLEFLMMMQRYASTPQNEAARVKEAFKIFDKDHSGLVSADELRNVMHNVGENLSDAELRSMILVADQHGDGEISLEDFEAMMSTDADSHRLAPVTTDEEVRAQRVSNVRRQFERLAPHEAAPSQDQIVHALRQSDYHAGMAVSQLLGPVDTSSEIEASSMSSGQGSARVNDSILLPEYMMQKLEDLNSAEEVESRENAEIQAKFDVIDRDKNQKLDMNEFAVLAKETGLGTERQKIIANFNEIDEDKDGFIGCDEFSTWWKRKMREDDAFAKKLRNLGRKEGTAKIKIPSVRLSVRARDQATRTQKFLHSGLPNKTFCVHVVGAGLTVYTSKDERVEKARLQLSDPDVKAVHRVEALPGCFHIELESEGQTYMVPFELQEKEEREEDAVQEWIDLIDLAIYRGMQLRSGAELWAKLRRRLDMVMQMQEQWGTLAELYGGDRSDFDVLESVPRFIRHPNSTFSVIWDMMQLVLLMGVSWNVPLRTGFDVEVPLWTFAFLFDLYTDIYFVIDVFVQFRTAYYDEKGVLVVDKKVIAKGYLKGWFPIDFVSCLPVGYVQYFAASGDSGGGGQELRSLKALRLLRLGKMLRLAKIMKMLQKYDNFAELKPFLSVITVLALVFLAAHLLACFWFLLGLENQSIVGADGEDAIDPTTNKSFFIYGWVDTKYVGSGTLDDPGDDGAPWWGVGGSKAALSTKYVTSMYGIFNALENGFTDSEKAFAIFSELVVGSLIYGGLAATLTAGLTERSAAENEFNTKYKALKTWMRARGVAKAQQNRVLDYYSHKYKDNTVFDEQVLLDDMPPAMATHMLHTLYGTYLARLPYFRGLDEALLIKLSAAVHPMTSSKNTEIIREGSIGDEMYILVEGELSVEKGGIQLGYLTSAGSFFGEVPVLDPQGEKVPRSRTVRAITDCFLVYLERDDVQGLADRYPELKVRLRRFARLGERKNLAEDREQRKDDFLSPTGSAPVPIIEKALAAKLPAAMQPGMVVDHHAHGLASQVDRIQSTLTEQGERIAEILQLLRHPAPAPAPLQGRGRGGGGGGSRTPPRAVTRYSTAGSTASQLVAAQPASRQPARARTPSSRSPRRSQAGGAVRGFSLNLNEHLDSDPAAP